MIFQRFLRGISDPSLSLNVEAILREDGLRSAWLRKNDPSDPRQWVGLVDEDALHWHVCRHTEWGHPLAASGPFGEWSPFISVSAGTAEPDPLNERNRTYPAWHTAIAFATEGLTVPGWVFSGYVNLLGKRALPLLEMAEEVRDIHQSAFFNVHHPEGEIAAKVHIAPVRIEGAVLVEPDRVADILSHLDQMPDLCPCDSGDDALQNVASDSRTSPHYVPPEVFANIRSIL